MTVLYILIGVFFVLLTGLNIYAYLTIVGMSRSYAELGFISRNFRFEFKSANDALQEILNGDKEKNLDKDVWNPLKEAEDFIPTLKKLEPSLEDLAKTSKNSRKLRRRLIRKAISTSNSSIFPPANVIMRLLFRNWIFSKAKSRM